MSTNDLYKLLEAVNVSMAEWEDEWVDLGKLVDDHENALRRRAADTKYESRTRNLRQPGINYEEPDFAVKGYKAREKEGTTETRYLQGQDRIMATVYGFEYDPHPSKIGKQNPETQQAGVMTRGRSLRNQPRQTAKATETEEVVGKRLRKQVQSFDPAAFNDVSRSSTPAPARGRRRKNANEADEAPVNPSVSFASEAASDGEANASKGRRKRDPRGKSAIANSVEDTAVASEAEEPAVEEEPKSGRRRRMQNAPKYEEADPNEFVEDEPQPEEQPVRRHLLTLKIPKGAYIEGSLPATPNNGPSRPSTASSEASNHTAESSYSFRPKRQKRFRDDPDQVEENTQAPPKKRGKRANATAPLAEADAPMPDAPTAAPTPEPSQNSGNKRLKVKVVPRPAAESKSGTSAPPAVGAEDGDEAPKDYKSMTKSEKMSASMKSKFPHNHAWSYMLTPFVSRSLGQW